MIQPQSVTLLPGGSQQFNSSVEGTTWTTSPTLGAITAGLYTAPKSLWLSRTVDVIALDANGQETGRASVTISSVRNWMAVLGFFWGILSLGLLSAVLVLWPRPAPPPSVSIYPPVATLHAGDTLQFLSSASGKGTATVLWTASEGQITPSGVFTAPAMPGGKPIMVTATRDADRTQTATAQVIIHDRKLVMDRSVVNSSAMKPGSSIQFHAVGPMGPEDSLRWYLSGPGDLDTVTGKYTVPDQSGSEVIITAVDPKGARKAAAVVELSRADVMGDSPILLLVILMGAFGALLGGMRSFVNFVGSRTFVPSWGFYYLSRPVFGAGLALIVFLAYRIGAITGPQGASSADPFAAAFVAGVVGLFADTFLQKLQELITQLFRPADARADKLGATSTPAPALTGLAVDQGMLTITGTNFGAGATVSINGTGFHPTVMNPTKLTLPLPAALAAKGTKLDVTVTNPDGAKSSLMSVSV